jgi:RecA-family ATPase
MEIPKKRNVLYVYLEGGISQVQIRYKELYGKDVEFPESLNFIFRFPPLDAGGLTQIREAIKQHHADLVIIDTWQRARVDDGRKGLNAYQKEYKEVEILSNEICNVTGCAVLLLHHLKQPGKGQTIDNLNALNGSAALGGASDFVLILNRDRGADTAQMHAHGRDFEDLEISLIKGDTMFWRRSESDAGSLILSPETEAQRQIVRVLQDAPDEGLTAREIALEIPGCSYNTVLVQLNRWTKEGKIDKTAKRYRLFGCQEITDE